MIYKNCIDACFDCVKACDRFSFEGCKTSKECTSAHDLVATCADVCTLVGRTTAKGTCCSDLYELCCNYCEAAGKHCEKIDHEYAKAVVEAAKKCVEACRQCAADCKKDEKLRSACC